MSHRIVPFRDLEEERVLFGNLDRNLHLLRRLHDIEAISRAGALKLTGDPDDLDRAVTVVERALSLIRSGRQLEDGAVERIFREGKEDVRETNRASASQGGAPRWAIEPRSDNQARYLEAIHAHTVTFGLGPAGTGKSFLAIAAAVAYLKAGAYRRLVLSRPAVEAGENLGFLPGDLSAKIDPYLRPLYDALKTLLPRGHMERYLEEGVIEVLPLAYMRGRTLDEAIIVLDEAQNATTAQMKMALTRLGRASKMIITGDVTQVDLPRSRESGLLTARRILRGIEDVNFIHLARGDIVRHPVVADIVHAFGRDEERQRQEAGPGRRAPQERRES